MTTRDIADTVRVATIGDVDAALAKVSVDDRQIPVRVQFATDLREDLTRIGALKVVGASGQAVPLNAVASIEIAEGPNSIERLNRQRKATIGANLPTGVALGTATERFKEIVAGLSCRPPCASSNRATPRSRRS